MNKLLQLLADGRFHSGQELGDALGVSRGSVWKNIGRIEEEYGIDLHRIRGRGYRLAGPLSLLDGFALQNHLRSPKWSLFLYPSVDSTNAEALRLLSAGAPPPFVVLAEAQKAGRGRRGRKWISPVAQNLYYSLAYRITGGFQQLSGLSLVAGLAVMVSLRNLGVRQIGLKWPNDIYAGGKKLAGVLLELSGDPADVCHVVIGVGINVNMVSTKEQIDQPWTSLRTELGHLVDRNSVATCLSDTLHSYLQRHTDYGFASIQEEWEREHIWQGRDCVLSTASQQVYGRVVGIDEMGGLRLEVDGVEKSFNSGELSLRLAP